MRSATDALLGDPAPEDAGLGGPDDDEIATTAMATIARPTARGNQRGNPRRWGGSGSGGGGGSRTFGSPPGGGGRCCGSCRTVMADLLSPPAARLNASCSGGVLGLPRPALPTRQREVSERRLARRGPA